MLIRRRTTHYLLLDNCVIPFLNKFETPSPKGALCQVWLKLAEWFWRRGFLNSVNVFSVLRNYLPLEKGMALRFNKLESPLAKHAFAKFGRN